MTTVTRRTPTCATCRTEHACTLFSVLCHNHLSHPHWLKSSLSPSFHPHTIHDERFSLSCSTSPFTSTCTSPSFFLSFLSMYSDDFDSVTNNLRDSAKGSLVTYDETFPLTFPGSCILGMHSKTMPKKLRYCGQLQNHVWIANFRGGSREITIPSKSSYFFMVLWHGRSCQEMCGAILWASQKDDATTLQSIYSMQRWPPLQRRRNEICWRIVTSMLSNCSEVLILGTYWTTWYSMVSE